MKVIYQGTDITGYIHVQKCVVRDTVGRADSINIVLENPAGWYRWAPKEDDVIRVTHKGYTSGDMYVHTILPEMISSES